MAPSPFTGRLSPHARNKSSLFRYLFPRTRAKPRARIPTFPHGTVPSFRYQAQSRIYQYLVRRQARYDARLQRLCPNPLTMPHRKEKRRSPGGIFGLIRRRTRRLFGFRNIKDDTHDRQKMSSSGNYGSEGYNSLAGFGGGGAREPGARRKKFAGYLKAANELRQSYQQSYGSSFIGNSRDASTDHINEMSNAFPEAAIVRGGSEEMIVFPSYARKHVKQEVNICKPSLFAEC